jgi:hypothetical protein
MLAELARNGGIRAACAVPGQQLTLGIVLQHHSFPNQLSTPHSSQTFEFKALCFPSHVIMQDAKMTEQHSPQQILDSRFLSDQQQPHKICTCSSDEESRSTPCESNAGRTVFPAPPMQTPSTASERMCQGATSPHTLYCTINKEYRKACRGNAPAEAGQPQRGRPWPPPWVRRGVQHRGRGGRAQ